MLLHLWLIYILFTLVCRDYRGSRASAFDGIEEGGIRASSSYSSHEIDEHDNDRALDGLADRVNLLKKVSSSFPMNLFQNLFYYIYVSFLTNLSMNISYKFLFNQLIHGSIDYFPPIFSTIPLFFFSFFYWMRSIIMILLKYRYRS